MPVPPDDFRPRVVRSARAIADGYFRPPYCTATAPARRFAAKVLRAPDSDFVFTDLMMRLDPSGSPCLEVAVATDDGLTKELEKVWEKAAAEFDPGVDMT